LRNSEGKLPTSFARTGEKNINYDRRRAANQKARGGAKEEQQRLAQKKKNDHTNARSMKKSVDSWKGVKKKWLWGLKGKTHGRSVGSSDKGG